MKTITSTILLFLLGAMGVSLFHMSMNMNMAGSMSDCPFGAHEEIICPMNVSEHTGAWKSAFLAVTPVVAFLLACVGAVVFVVSVAPHLSASKQKPIPISQKQLREWTYAFSYRPLQELFSSGVLHPKLF